MPGRWLHPATTLLRERGPPALLDTGGRPAVAHTTPFGIAAASGDVIFCSYLLSHETGPHDAGDPRATVYFRLCVDGHASNWRSAVTDELSEFDAVRAAHRPDH